MTHYSEILEMKRCKGWRMKQPIRRFTYVTALNPTLPLLHLRHSSFYNPQVASNTSQLILKPFRRFTYVTAHSPSLPQLHLRHSSFSIPSIASLTSQLILQPFRRSTYVTNTSPTSPEEPPMIEMIVWALENTLHTFV